MKKSEDYECAQIIDDSSDEEKHVVKEEPIKKKTRVKKPQIVLKGCHNEDDGIIEIGVDEAGRGPLFGRVYTAAVILPKDPDLFDFSMVKDSKKYHSKKKIEEAAEYVKQNALAWCVTFEDERKIDEINILQATQLSMHNSINSVMDLYKKAHNNNDYDFNLLIDGNYFKPISRLNKSKNRIEHIPYMTVEGGDNKYASIAAASILAKVGRDNYIEELCAANPELAENYGIDSNKGYGAKKHTDGIKEHGITIWHRRSFAPCKNYV